MVREQSLEVLQIVLQNNQKRSHLGLHVVFYYEDNFQRTKRLPEIPFCLSLKINPSCHTLSKALEISRKTARPFLVILCPRKPDGFHQQEILID